MMSIYKVSKTHSKLKKARDNIQTRLDEQDMFGKDGESSQRSRETKNKLLQFNFLDLRGIFVLFDKS